ncbi:MAG: hypothetical protein ACD_54C00641G0002 [uncultured bacterium]|nr:MAG: hypothetical protein ACD_54C00641G0002 [uncultured bacterium]
MTGAVSIKAPALFLAQIAGDSAPINGLFG